MSCILNNMYHVSNKTICVLKVKIKNQYFEKGKPVQLRGDQISSGYGILKVHLVMFLLIVAESGDTVVATLCWPACQGRGV